MDYLSNCKISKDCKDFLKSCLRPNPSKRINYNDFDEIFGHPWFNDISINDIYNKKHISPLKEYVNSNTKKLSSFSNNNNSFIFKKTIDTSTFCNDKNGKEFISELDLDIDDIRIVSNIESNDYYVNDSSKLSNIINLKKRIKKHSKLNGYTNPTNMNEKEILVISESKNNMRNNYDNQNSLFTLSKFRSSDDNYDIKSILLENSFKSFYYNSYLYHNKKLKCK